MKKIFTLMATVAALFATSCANDATDVVSVDGGETLVTLTAEAPVLASRTTGDGTTAKNLFFAVYDDQWKFLKEGTSTFNSELKATVQLRLVNNKVYNFVFWAQAEGAEAFYAIDWDQAAAANATPKVTITYGTKANDETRDAFFGQCPNLLVNGTISNKEVPLFRPFAQINFGASTEEVDEAKVGGFDITTGANAKVKFSVEAYNQLSLKDGAILDNASTTIVTFTDNSLMNDLTGEALIAKHKEVDATTGQELTSQKSYHWVSMNYILWHAERGTLNHNKITVTTGNGKVVDVVVPNANVQRNYKTNIVGRLFTDPVEFIVEIKPGFNDDEYTHEFEDRQ